MHLLPYRFCWFRKCRTLSPGTTIENANAVDEFNNLMQQMINFIFVELWKNYADD
jgi:hypothetical protein